MRIQAVTPSFTARQTVQNKKVVTRPIEKPMKQIDVQTPQNQKKSPCIMHKFNLLQEVFVNLIYGDSI